MVTVAATSVTVSGTLDLFDSDTTKLQSLARFDAAPDKSGSSHTFFAGGPIWASDWCPKAAAPSDKSQVLAISTDCDPDALDLMVKK